MIPETAELVPVRLILPCQLGVDLISDLLEVADQLLLEDLPQLSHVGRPYFLDGARDMANKAAHLRGNFLVELIPAVVLVIHWSDGRPGVAYALGSGRTTQVHSRGIDGVVL